MCCAIDVVCFAHMQTPKCLIGFIEMPTFSTNMARLTAWWMSLHEGHILGLFLVHSDSNVSEEGM
jgi:hypothetical protein